MACGHLATFQKKPDVYLTRHSGIGFAEGVKLQ